MQFKTEAQKHSYLNVQEMLIQLFGDGGIQCLDECFVLQEGSTFVYVRCFPIGPDRAGIEVFSYVIMDVEITPELARLLLGYNLRLTVGAFAAAERDSGKGEVLLTHTLLGEGITPGLLYSTICAMARIADSMDDVLVDRFGGATALGKLTERHPPAERWE